MPTFDEFLLDCLNEFRPMLARIADAYGLEEEDTFQDAAVLILQYFPKWPGQQSEPRAWLNVVVRRRILQQAQRAKRRIYPLSLDMPANAESDTTLGELLPATSPDQYNERRTMELYIALRRLPFEEQQYLRKQYHLIGFHPCRKLGRRVSPNASNRSLAVTAFYWLRQDATLRRALGLQ